MKKALSNVLVFFLYAIFQFYCGYIVSECDIDLRGDHSKFYKWLIDKVVIDGR